MSRALLSWPSAISLVACVAVFGCSAASAPPRPLHPGGDQRPSQSAAQAEPIPMVVGFTPASEMLRSADPFEASFLPAEETIVTVDEDSVEDSLGVFRFIAATRGNQPVGVRVFFASAEEGDDDTHLGLQRADRIEEIDGLPVAGLDTFLSAWRNVGVKSEVRFSLSRAGRPHTLVYRRRTPAMLLAY
jgi:hypothetical protein